MSLSTNFPNVRPSLLLDFAGSRKLDPRITFTRAATAVYYDGVTTAMAEQNLISQSQTFSTTPWGLNSATLISNSVAAPDGTTTAFTLTDNTANDFHSVFQPSIAVGSVPSTVSVYMKSGTAQYGFLIFFTGSTYIGVIADLTGGTIASTIGTLTGSSITPVGNAWYRVSITATFITSSMQIGISNSATPTLNVGRPTYTGTGTNTIYIWGAQAEQRSAVTAYTPTTTQAITNYIPKLQTAAADVARFDHNPTTGESLGLLIEEARTNLLTYSEQFDNAVWNKSNSTCTANAVVAPDGTLTGDKWVEAATFSTKEIYRSISASAATYTLSVYAKAAGRNVLRLSFATASLALGGGSYFNLSNGTNSGATNYGATTGTTVSMTSVGNGWYLCSVTVTATAATYYVDGMMANDSLSVGYTGDGYSGIFIWGAQLEAGAFATSYIPTVASQVTRAADSASMTGVNFSSWYNNAEGTVYAEALTYNSGANALNSNAWSISAGANAASNVFQYIQYGSTPGATTLFGYSTASLDINIQKNGTVTANTFIKMASGIKLNDYAYSVNGSTVGADTSAGVPVVDRLSIGSLPNGVNATNGTIKKLAYYPKRLTNAQLQNLTLS